MCKTTANFDNDPCSCHLVEYMSTDSLCPACEERAKNPTAACDGCDRQIPESDLTDSVARYVDESTETFRFCGDCLKSDAAYDTHYSEGY